MILVVASALWLLALIAITLYPSLERNRRRSWQIDLGVVGWLGVATAGFFWRFLFPNGVRMPAGGGDLAGFLYPTYEFAAEWWRRGVIPLWNPYLFGGMSFVGDIQASLFYPPNLLTFFLTNPLTYRDLELLAVLHFFLAGAGMYALLRFGNVIASPWSHSMGGSSRAACLAGAVAFAFSDLFITHFGTLNLIASAFWLPLVFLFVSLALDKKSLSAAATSGIVLALAFFAGHIQPFLFIVLTLALYTMFRSVRARADARRVRPHRRSRAAHAVRADPLN